MSENKKFTNIKNDKILYIPEDNDTRSFNVGNNM